MVVQLALHVRVEIRLVIMVVREGRVNLGERKMRMRRVNFLRVPSVGYVVHRHFNDFGIAVGNPCHAAIIPSNMSNGLDNHADNLGDSREVAICNSSQAGSRLPK